MEKLPLEDLEVLKILCHRLSNVNVPYMITGSVAANFYAAPRMTRDIDIVLALTIGDIDRFLDAMKDDFYVEPETVKRSVRESGMFNIIHNQSIIKVDCIVRKDTLYRRNEFDRRLQAEVADEKVWMVSPEDLILSKLLWAKDSRSEMQLRDIQNIMSMLKDLDMKYIDRWVVDLGLQEIFQVVKT